MRFFRFIMLLFALLMSVNPVMAETQPSVQVIAEEGKSSLLLESLNQPHVIRNIQYNAHGRMDVYVPSKTNTAKTGTMSSPQKKTAARNKAKQMAVQTHPVILFIHGGSFKSGVKEQMAGYCNLFAQAGFVTATLDYRLSTEAPYPAALLDVKDAIAWLQSHATQYQSDPKRTVLVGYSAGGTLALLAGMQAEPVNASNAKLPDMGRPAESMNMHATASHENRDGVKSTFAVKTEAKPVSFQKILPVAGIVSIAGITDFQSLESETDLPQFRKDLAQFLQETPRAAASPVSYVSPKSPPVLLIHGEKDDLVPVSQSKTLLEALVAQNIPAALRVYPKVGHDIFFPNPQLGRVLRELTEFFLYVERHPAGKVTATEALRPAI